MIYCIDLDGVICTTDGMNYNYAIPKHDVIEKINDLWHRHTIVISTGRHKRYKELTIAQLESWAVKYDVLDIGNKVAADCYIDDKAINIKDWL